MLKTTVLSHFKNFINKFKNNDQRRSLFFYNATKFLKIFRFQFRVFWILQKTSKKKQYDYNFLKNQNKIVSSSKYLQKILVVNIFKIFVFFFKFSYSFLTFSNKWQSWNTKFSKISFQLILLHTCFRRLKQMTNIFKNIWVI